MTFTRPFSRAFTCAAICCGYAIPYAWMDEPARTWPIVRTIVAALFAAIVVGTVAVRFGWPLRWWQFAVAVLLVQILGACILEFAARQTRPNHLIGHSAVTEQLKYLFLLFPIVGFGLFVGGLAYRRRLKERAARCERTTGIVVDSVSGLAGGFDTSPVYRPVVEFAVGSARFTVTGDTGYGRPKEKGTRLVVMFSPENPAVAFIAVDYYFLAHMLLAIGGTFVAFGSVLAYHLLT